MLVAAPRRAPPFRPNRDRHIVTHSLAKLHDASRKVRPDELCRAGWNESATTRVVRGPDAFTVPSGGTYAPSRLPRVRAARSHRRSRDDQRPDARVLQEGRDPEHDHHDQRRLAHHVAERCGGSGCPRRSRRPRRDVRCSRRRWPGSRNGPPHAGLPRRLQRQERQRCVQRATRRSRAQRNVQRARRRTEPGAAELPSHARPVRPAFWRARRSWRSWRSWRTGRSWRTWCSRPRARSSVRERRRDLTTLPSGHGFFGAAFSGSPVCTAFFTRSTARTMVRRSVAPAMTSIKL